MKSNKITHEIAVWDLEDFVSAYNLGFLSLPRCALC